MVASEQNSSENSPETSWQREGGRADSRLPVWLGRYTTVALYGLAVGTVAALFAFVTNPVPDPSFAWASLPESWRLPVRQPRIEHWPVSYTIGIWLWAFGFPALFLKGHELWGQNHRRGTALWLIWLPVLAMYGWTAYCRFGWPKLEPATWNAPSYTFVCWMYCSTYEPIWSNLAFGVATLGLLAVVLLDRRASGAQYLLVAFGLLSLPLGLPALEAARRLGEGPDLTG